MAYISNRCKARRGGKRCVSGGPNLVTCFNDNKIEGIFMHLFAKEETDVQR